MPSSDTVIYWLSDRLIRGAIWLMLRMPFDARRRVSGWIVAHVAGPIGGYGKRIRANLALICPEMPEAEVRRMVRAVPENIGKSLFEQTLEAKR